VDAELKEIFKPIARFLTLVFFAGPLISLYTTFVLKNLWNWFATGALHLPEISFWVMYGLVLIIGMFTSDFGDLDHERRFKVLATALDACVPEDKREWVNEQLADLQSSIWTDIGFKIFGKILDTTWILVIGWVVHAFLL
jgi:hypothetical protein